MAFASKLNGFHRSPASALIKPTAKPVAKKVQPIKQPSRIDRLPPHSKESEQGVIGCILTDPRESMATIAARAVSSEAFYDIRHRTIFETVVAMSDKNEPLDFITIMQKMKDQGTLEQIGDVAYLSELQDAVPSTANLTYWLRLVEEKALLRKMLFVCTETATKVYDHTGDTDELIDEFERDALSLKPTMLNQKAIKAHVQEAIAHIEDKFNNKGAILGLSTGFPDLDYITDGLCAAELIVPAAFPGDGKTSLSMNFVEHAILAHNEAVAVFSQEMTSRQLVVRMLCSIAKVNGKQIGRGNMIESDFPRLTASAGRLANSRLHIVEDAESVQQIVAASRRLHQQHKIKLIVVDYLQLVTGGGRGKDANREQEISGVAASLKRLAKELNIPVVAPSQLTDDGKLRESRAIGQHADLILKLNPHEVQEGYEYDAQPVDVFVEKNRNGPSKVTVHLTFMKQFTRFESAAKVTDGDIPN